jgi:riboflavin kinase/FMN adenylyltransferase
VLCVIPFTKEFSRLEPKDFVLQVLVEHLHARTVIVGDNFRFGHDALGDVMSLRTLGTRFGFTVEGADLLEVGGITYSSTFIRSCIAGGDVRTAAEALGRPHRLDGIVVRGDQRGRSIGFPTANLETQRFAAIPADGVYAAWLEQRGKRYMAAVHVGTNSTFAGTERRVEAYVLDFDGDLYGEHISIDLIERLRGSVRFPGAEELVVQMNIDVDKTRDLLS